MSLISPAASTGSPSLTKVTGRSPWTGNQLCWAIFVSKETLDASTSEAFHRHVKPHGCGMQKVKGPITNYFGNCYSKRGCFVPGTQPSSSLHKACALGSISGDEQSQITSQKLLCWAWLGPNCWAVFSASVPVCAVEALIPAGTATSKKQKAQGQHCGLPSSNSCKKKFKNMTKIQLVI